MMSGVMVGQVILVLAVLATAGAGPGCRGVSGKRCKFPFQWGGRTFHTCTTHRSESGAARCATKVRGRGRRVAKGHLEDCAAPCAAPLEVVEEVEVAEVEECPAEQPELGSTCTSPGLECRFGEECCCGACHASFLATCAGGSWLGLHTDACYRQDCS